MEPKDIAALQVDEIKTHAPLLFAAIRDEGKSEVQTLVGEQTTLVAELQPQAEMLVAIKQALKLADGENPVEKVTNLLKQIEDASASEIKSFIKELVAKKVKTERGQALLHRLIGEMHVEYAGQELDDALKTKITADFDKKAEEDEHIKELVGEMAPFAETNGGSTGGAALGGRSRAGDDRGRVKDNGVVSQNANLTVRKRTLA